MVYNGKSETEMDENWGLSSFYDTYGHLHFNLVPWCTEQGDTIRKTHDGRYQPNLINMSIKLDEGAFQIHDADADDDDDDDDDDPGYFAS